MTAPSKNKFSLKLLEAHPWRDNSNPIWLATTLKLYRNVAKYLFPTKMDGARQKQLLEVLSKALCGISDLHHAAFLHGNEVSSLEKQFLFEHFLFLQALQEASHQTEGFIVDDSGKFLAVLNLKDHLQMQVTDCQQDLENGFKQILHIESELGKMFEWSYNSRFGFLTANPRHCGTGLVARLFLHLPALLTKHALEDLIADLDGVEIAGMQGVMPECVGDIVVVSNRYTLGVSEDEIIRALRLAATRLITEEKKARASLIADDDLKNRISRAYGMLLHSYQFETEETLNCLSLCKLALDMGFLAGTSHQQLNALFFDCRRAHLLSTHDENVQDEVAKARAKLVHEAFAGCNLTI